MEMKAKRGRPKGLPSKHINLRIKLGLYDKVKSLAAVNNRSLSNQIESMLLQHLSAKS